MKKLLYILAALVFCSCKPSPTQNFEDAIKEVTGKSVSYEKEMYNYVKEQNKDEEFYMYYLNYGDDKDDRMITDFCYLLHKVDSIMKTDYHCTNSPVDSERYSAILREANRRSGNILGYEDRPYRPTTHYHWIGKDENGKTVDVNYSICFRDENIDNNFIGLDIEMNKE